MLIVREQGRTRNNGFKLHKFRFSKDIGKSSGREAEKRDIDLIKDLRQELREEGMSNIGVAL